MIEREGYEREEESVDVRDEAVVIDLGGRDPMLCCGMRLGLAVDSVLADLSGNSHVGLSVEKVDCAGIPVRLTQDGGSLDSGDQDGGSGCPGVKDGGSG
jgi:hypothetical protein